MSQPVFRFAVMADSHVNPSVEEHISPFESHRLTNVRMAHSVEVLNSLSPAFVMHVGDMIHPVPEAVSYPAAVAIFKAATEKLDAPLHLVPGNHDIGDKRADYVPAGEICDDYLDLYQQHFGSYFYSFDHEDCHFVVINTSLINSGLRQERAQADWLVQDLAENRGKRVMLFVHYPPYIAKEDEHGHYDNIDEPGRSWLLGLIREFKLTAVFTGHVHNFFFNTHGSTPIFSLPSTAFVRGDYSELFAIGQPAEHENGRNDVSKLGVLLVDVYPDRIVPQFIRTFDRPAGEAPQVQKDWPLLAPGASPGLSGLGIDLRYSWNEVHQIPYSSMLDEFQRKEARNDYPILALWEMGISKLRVPLQDLLHQASRDRMVAMAGLGARFIVFVFGFPNEEHIKLLAEHRRMLCAVELILKWPLSPELPQQLESVQDRLDTPLHVSRFWSASGQSRDGKQIKLLVDHGFAGSSDSFAQEIVSLTRGRSLNGLVFRVPSDMPVDTGIDDAVQFASNNGLRAQVHIRLASDSPAQARNDAQANGARVLAAAFSARALPAVADILIDTLSDVDRGYFPRAGLVDRRFNPKKEGQALRNLHGLLSAVPALTELSWQCFSGTRVAFARAGSRHFALCPRADAEGQQALESYGRRAGVNTVRCVDLVSGEAADWACLLASAHGALVEFAG